MEVNESDPAGAANLKTPCSRPQIQSRALPSPAPDTASLSGLRRADADADGPGAATRPELTGCGNVSDELADGPSGVDVFVNSAGTGSSTLALDMPIEE